MPAQSLIAAVDLGGTTAKFGIANETGEILAQDRVRTGDPDTTLTATSSGLRRLADDMGGKIGRLGIACFGPVDVDASSPTYGTILTTPKPKWSGTPVLAVLSDALGVSGSLDTDVNAALEGEQRWGNARGVDRAAYVTIGTGIGVGIKINDTFAGRPFHPELGHVRVSRFVGDEAFEGCCSFHGDCLEGLTAAPALISRFGPLEQLERDSTAWDLAAHYLAQLTVVLVLGFRVQRVLFGGGVSNAPIVVDQIRAHHDRLLAGYVQDVSTKDLIAKAYHGDRAGLYGACALALSL